MHHDIPGSAELVFQGKIFSVWQWEQKLYDGSTAVFERVVRPDAAFVLPILEDGRLLLIRDEQPHRPPVLTLAGGKVEPGETPEIAAARELTEETGYAVSQLLPWFAYDFGVKVSCTFSFFIGRGAYVEKEARPEAGEKITLLPHTFAEFVDVVRSGEFYNPHLRVLVLESLLQDPTMKELHTMIYGN